MNEWYPCHKDQQFSQRREEEEERGGGRRGEEGRERGAERKEGKSEEDGGGSKCSADRGRRSIVERGLRAGRPSPGTLHLVPRALAFSSELLLFPCSLLPFPLLRLP